MKTMTKFMFSALCAAAMVTSVSAQGGKDMLSNGIKYLDVPYVAHTLEADGPEELVINCDEVDCTTLVEYVLAETLTPKLADGDISESAFRDVSVGQFGGKRLCQYIFHQRGTVYFIAVDDEFFGTICFQRMGYVWHIQILYSIAQHIFPSLGRNGSYHGCGAEGAEHKFSHCFHFSFF